MEGQKVFRIGPFRPPSEAKSLLLQVTQGCTWNKCRFCQMYRHVPFKVFSVDSIKGDIDVMKYYADLALECRDTQGQWDLQTMNNMLKNMSRPEVECAQLIFNWVINGGKTVFLQDGNTLALSASKLKEVLNYLKEVFPQIERITSYGRAQTLAQVTKEEYKELKNAGLDRIHSGFESGSQEVLDFINKGVDVEELIQAGKNIKAGGIELSVYFMPGIGGKALSEKNAEGMAHVVNQVNPDYVRIRTAVIKEGTELWNEYKCGKMKLCSDDDKVKEIRQLINLAEACDGCLVSDHIVNLLQNVEGSLKEDRDFMLEEIDKYLERPEVERKMYQIARRSGRADSIEYLDGLHEIQKNQLQKMVLAYGTEEQWNERINDMLSRYI